MDSLNGFFTAISDFFAGVSALAKDHVFAAAKWLWESLPWVAAFIAMCSSFFSFMSNIVQISESRALRYIWRHKSMRRVVALWHNARRRSRVKKLRAALAEAEAESELKS